MIADKIAYIYLKLTVSVNCGSFESCTIPLLKSNILSFASGKPYRNQEEVHKAGLPFPCAGTCECVFMLLKWNCLF